MNTNLIDRIKLLFRKDKELYFQLYKILGFYPHNLELYRTAFAHRSKQLHRNGRPQNNERLEYLGDAVLETVVSDILFHRFPRKHEGFLTNCRSKVVQRSTLNSLAEQMGIARLIQFSVQPTTHSNIGGNAFEAFIGAIYLDRGFRKCYEFVDRRMLGRYIKLDALVKKEENFKSKLLEWSQKHKVQVEFCLVDSKVDGAFTRFRSAVMLEGLAAGEGTGFSKKESEQFACRKAMERLRRDHKFRDSIFAAKAGRAGRQAEATGAPAQGDRQTQPKA